MHLSFIFDTTFWNCWYATFMDWSLAKCKKKIPGQSTVVRLKIQGNKNLIQVIVPNLVEFWSIFFIIWNLNPIFQLHWYCHWGKSIFYILSRFLLFLNAFSGTKFKDELSSCEYSQSWWKERSTWYIWISMRDFIYWTKNDY